MGAEDPVRSVIHDLVDAWNRQDWSSFSRLFAQDADYVTGAGVRLAGRRSIHEDLSSRTAEAAAAGPVSLAVHSLKLARPDVAVALCQWQMGEGGTGVTGPVAARAGLLTIVLLAERDEWRIIAMHNTDSSGQGPGRRDPP